MHWFILFRRNLDSMTFITSFKEKKDCPYCGNGMEWGALTGRLAFFWYPNPERKWWGLKGQNKVERIVKNALGVPYKYGYRCKRCNLLILDIRDSNEIEQLKEVS